MRDKNERRHRKTAANTECVGVMAGADFDAVPSLSEAMGLESKPRYTHIGCRPHTGYRHIGRDANHYSPKTGKTHALVALEGDRDNYVAVCGELVRGTYDDDHDFCSEVGLGQFSTVETAPDAEGTGVTCARCRKLLGVQRWAVQAMSLNWYGRWYTVKDRNKYTTKAEAEAAMEECRRMSPRQPLRVRMA